MNPAILALLPLLPGLLKGVMDIVNLVNKPDATPEEVKAQLDLLSVQLKETAAKVAAVELPNP